ncbi:hypothetical protein BDW02DRAFT_189485 [Decorospora gaudefroyi]|uniref:Uncharacterized protein n=1 Tax=Decorospora gaudefroyi TaxID=184978 RepID=A0A6A5KIT7_9PLEO|nr:hypothetical protein BDW02DRAFT_189485 [Decorospora gaudefroyi]
MESLGGPDYIQDPSKVAWSSWKTKVDVWNELKHIRLRTYQGQARDNMEDAVPSVAPYKSVVHQYNTFLSLASQYTFRSLRYESDAMNAFNGVMQSLREKQPPVYQFAGLPFYPWGSEHAHVKEAFILYSLSWFHYAAEELPRRRLSFPSWTWAGWTGAVSWYITSTDDEFVADNFFICVQNVQFASSATSTLSLQSDSDFSQHFLETVTAIQFVARVIPSVDLSVGDSMPVHDAVTWDDIPLSASNGWIPGLLPPFTPSEFYANIEAGIWSCLLLGCLWERHSAFVLLVEWKDEPTAVRVAGWPCLSPHFVDRDVILAFERREVRLV